MSTINYKQILETSIEEYKELLRERQEKDLQVAKKYQFIQATLNMVSDDERDQYQFFEIPIFVEEVGLTEAIKQVLQRTTGWITAAGVRDEMIRSEFDFSQYKSNPLASVHSVLKRLKGKDVESTEIDGVMAWQWRGESRTMKLGDLTRTAVGLAPALGPPPPVTVNLESPEEKPGRFSKGRKKEE